MLDILEVQKFIIDKLNATGEFRQVGLYYGDWNDLDMTLLEPSVHIVYLGADIQSDKAVKSRVRVRFAIYLVTKSLVMDMQMAEQNKDMAKVLRDALHGCKFQNIVLLWKKESLLNIKGRTYIYEHIYEYDDYLVM